jgi:hypothetical protein
MASELRVNTLKDASGNNSIGMSYVAEGSAKAWFKLNGSGTIAGLDSFNIASFTDNGTGDYSGNFTSNMGNVNYSGVVNTGSNDVFGNMVGGSQATTLVRVTSHYPSSGNLDRDQVYTLVAGDLA